MGWGPIQLIPPGLLGFLNLKREGRNPETIGSEYVPTIDMREWLLQANLVDFLQISGSPGIGLSSGQTGPRPFSPIGITVPSGEAWWIDNFTIVTDDIDPATEAISYSPALTRPQTGTINEYMLGPPVSYPAQHGASPTTYRLSSSVRNFWAPPGSALIPWVHWVLSGTNVILSGYLRYQALRL